MTVPREWADKNFYGDLGVSANASQEEIKKAYRKLARENHPDKNPGDKAAEERFKKAATAYDVIGDEDKRREYDQLRNLLRQSGGFGGQGGSGFPGGFRQTSTNSGFNFGDFSGFSSFTDGFGSGSAGGEFTADGGLGDFIGSFVNRGGGGGRSARTSRGADVETEITLGFREAVRGTTIPIELSGQAACSTCHGSGSASGRPSTCSKCAGTGFLSEQKGAFGLSRPCDNCGGKGTEITDPCPTCRGSGTVHRTRTITVRIPAGVIDGQRVRLAGQGEAGPNGTPSGDLFVTVNVRDDEVFRREGDDLHLTVPVSFSELALGGIVTVPTLDSSVKVKIAPGTRDGRTLRVRGRGIPKAGGKAGDLMVTVKVTVPTKLDAAATSALRNYQQAEKASGFNPRAGWAGAR